MVSAILQLARNRMAAMISHKTYGVALIGNMQATNESIKQIHKLIAHQSTLGVGVGVVEVCGHIRCIDPGDYYISVDTGYPDAMDALMQLQQRQCNEAEKILHSPEDYGESLRLHNKQLAKEDPKPKGFDHTKFSRRKKR